MNTYNFDTIIDRTQTNSCKYGLLQSAFGRTDLLPLWIADMDFETPPFIRQALAERLAHPVYGYELTPDAYWTLLRQWLLDHHGWQVEREWLSYIPGIVRGIGMVVNVFVKPDEKVIIQPPVYHPFRLVPQHNRRQLVYNPLVELPEGGYAMDFDHLERVIDDKCRLLILSNPHNPAGICWSRETLQRLAATCAKHNILVISDEIHSDMTLWGNRHIPFATVSDEAARISITFGAPSKTFNIPGLVSSFAVVPDPQLRETFYTWLAANEMSDPSFPSVIAAMAAWEHGEPWRQEMLRYVEGNIQFVEQYCREHLPGIKPLRPQASFLVWLDCRGLGLSHEGLIDLFVNRAKLALNDGAMFGQEGSGFMRLNVGTPRAILAQALDQLRQAMSASK